MVNVVEKPWFHIVVARAAEKMAKKAVEKAVEKADTAARAEEQAKAAREKVVLLKQLAQTHPDITPTLEVAEKEALAAEAQLAQLNSHDE